MTQNLTKSIIFSVSFLVLAILTLSSASFWAGISEGLSPTNLFDWTIFKAFGILFASNYIFLAPYILGTIFIVLSVYCGIKALKTETGLKRWTALVSTVFSLFVLVTIILLLIVPLVSFAHPGNTASDGCHYCRTNCDRWGVEWNQRHCHDTGGNSYPGSTGARDDNNNSWIWWLGGAGLVGYFIWVGVKKK